MEVQRLLARLTLILFLIILGLGYLAWTPSDMKNHDGYDSEAMNPLEAENFLLSIHKSIQDGKSVQISELDINRLIKGKFSQQHSLVVRPWITPTGIYVNLGDGHMDLTIERNLNNLRNHQSQIRINFVNKNTDSERKYHRSLTLAPSGGKIGKLKLPRAIAGGFNSWYPVFAEKAKSQLVKLSLQNCYYEVGDGVLTISPPPSDL